ATPLLVSRRRLGQAGAFMVVVSATSLSVVLLSDHSALRWLSACLLGFSQGSTLALAYAMLGASPRPEQAAGLSSLMHGAGLSLAGLGPFAVGAIRGAANVH